MAYQTRDSECLSLSRVASVHGEMQLPMEDEIGSWSPTIFVAKLGMIQETCDWMLESLCLSSHFLPRSRLYREQGSQPGSSCTVANADLTRLNHPVKSSDVSLKVSQSWVL
jgi:hypothetical protein